MTNEASHTSLSLTKASWFRQLDAAFALMAVIPMLTLGYLFVTYALPSISIRENPLLLLGVDTTLALCGFMLLARLQRSLLSFGSRLKVIAHGDLNHPERTLSNGAPPELRDMLESTGIIVANLRESRDMLMRDAVKLEQTIIARTAELNAVNEALQTELSERRNVEKALQDLAAKWNLTFDAVSDGVCLLDSNQRIVLCNRSMGALFSATPETMKGRHCWEIVHGTRDPIAECPIPRVMKSLRRESTELHVGNRWFIVTADPALDASQRLVGFVHIVQDITARKQAEIREKHVEASMRQHQRLASLGVLAGGLAHEINNPLMSIIGCSELIKDRLPAGDTLQEFAETMIRESRRVATTVQHLLNFSQSGKHTRERHRPIDIVEAIKPLIAATMRMDRVLLNVDVAEDLAPVECHAPEIEQVLVALLTNARESLNEKYPGKHPNKVILLTAREIERDGGNWLRFTVEDRGAGIPSQVADRIFDPFFTTRNRATHAGLGLTSSQATLQEHGGALTVETEPGRYTRFQVDLPVAVQD